MGGAENIRSSTNRIFRMKNGEYKVWKDDRRKRVLKYFKRIRRRKSFKKRKRYKWNEKKRKYSKLHISNLDNSETDKESQ